MLPDGVIQDLASGAKVVEVGAGARFDLLEALAHKRPDLELVATDVVPERLDGAPAGVTTVVDDITRPDPRAYQGVALVVARRCPEELQRPVAELAARERAGLAVTVIKDELADVGDLVGQPRIVTARDGQIWRVWQPPGSEG